MKFQSMEFKGFAMQQNFEDIRSYEKKIENIVYFLYE